MSNVQVWPDDEPKCSLYNYIIHSRALKSDDTDIYRNSQISIGF